MQKRNIVAALVAAISLINLAAPLAHAAAPEDTYTWQRNLGTKGCQPENKYRLLTVSNGKSYVVNQNKGDISIFSSTGVYEKSFDTRTVGDSIYAIAHDTTGNIYVSAGNYHIEKFDANGTYVTSFGSQGAGNGQFGSTVGGIAIDATGKVYATDPSNGRIQVFDTSGTYLSQFGSSGAGNGQFMGPSHIAVGSTGRLYVHDNSNQRIQILDGTGTYLGQFGSRGTGNGQFSMVEGIAVDENGLVYVSDGESVDPHARVQVFDTNGTYLRQFGSIGFENGQFGYMGGIATDGNGKVYVADGGYRLSMTVPTTVNSRVSVFTLNGTYSGAISQTDPAVEPTNLCRPYASAVAPNGNIYVSDLYWNNIKVYNNTGSLVKTMGVPGSGNGQFRTPSGIFIDSSGKMYIVDTNNNRVQIFDANGTYLSQFGSFGSGNGQFNNPLGITLDSSGKMYIVDRDNYRVQVFDAKGTYLSQFGSQGTTDGKFRRPEGIAIDPTGNLHVADPTREQVQVFNPSGTFLRKYDVRVGRTGTKTMNPCGIAIDTKGNIFVGDWNIGPVKLSPDGTLLSTIAELGNQQGQLSSSMVCNVTVAPNGTLYIAEPWVNRISVWKSAASAVASQSNATSSPTTPTPPSLDTPVPPTAQLARTGLSAAGLATGALLMSAGALGAVCIARFSK